MRGGIKMTWFVDEYLDKQLRALDLCPNVDVTMSFHGDAKDSSEDIDVYIFWSKPNSSTDWYPIGQIDFGCRTIFHREGTENIDHWQDLLTEMAEFISNHKFLKGRV
jgi:hypothetical protein